MGIERLRAFRARLRSRGVLDVAYEDEEEFVVQTRRHLAQLVQEWLSEAGEWAARAGPVPGLSVERATLGADTLSSYNRMREIGDAALALKVANQAGGDFIIAVELWNEAMVRLDKGMRAAADAFQDIGSRKLSDDAKRTAATVEVTKVTKELDRWRVYSEAARHIVRRGFVDTVASIMRHHELARTPLPVAEFRRLRDDVLRPRAAFGQLIEGIDTEFSPAHRDAAKRARAVAESIVADLEEFGRMLSSATE